ncbi:Hypothetical protein PFCIRM119_05160 [Propionibacterium freudenreichii]|uniref:Uncharacterized protein n=1 Tax=Propionibacterium freudenreichii subsp. shermanii (strain ATCC 9614 / DSM 4902 / CIP 103027 / NCIMB 8099 / CIRM-BIA1) TaxID=754252 RepID=D7GFF3_PROFC|nr:Hypothetical protein PFREUD_17550 [Propionibacterium freudenreichii subsp. shermanii CIRM-BIA1]CDP48995.1 Hypothetical protein PFCIRM129_06180 [Propionibacterium freudenreichii subsp. freudenreichii]CEG86196.1 Hypothetical protein PFCIRM118_05145 [Propionibacterium freudenreichii]CEG87974.1 Hypothetical protein PFCIRM119_05160 [Propionibacterium freudenreichii]CEG91504.1 Hypothetical protein PFCIRM121_10415 [Propionibacterium freudenreichii]
MFSLTLFVGGAVQVAADAHANDAVEEQP